MTRHERLISIIENLGERRADYALARMIASRNRADRFNIYTDEAIEELADKMVSDWKHGNKINAQNRAIYARKMETV